MSKMVNPNKPQLEEAVSLRISEYISANPNKVKINNSVIPFSKIDDIQTQVISDYTDKDLRAGLEISIKVEGEISFKGKSDLNSDFSLKFLSNSIKFTYDSELESFNISEPDQIIMTS